MSWLHPAHQVLLDQWSTVSHKATVGDGRRVLANAAPSWVPESEVRRLGAYVALQQLLENVARQGLGEASPEQRKIHREYGDARLLTDRIVSGVTGDHFEPFIAGADDEVPDAPDLPPRPAAAPEGADPLTLEIARVQQERWDAEAEVEVERWREQGRRHPLRAGRQVEVRAWWDREHVASKWLEQEYDTVPLGDGLIVLWPRADDWPAVTVLEPNGYFPVLVDNQVGFPGVVNVAWEFEETDRHGRARRMVRRLRWELTDITGERIVVDGGGGAEWILDPDGSIALMVGEDVQPDGRVRRIHPWERDEQGRPLVDQVPDLLRDPSGRTMRRVERGSFTTCVFSNGAWDLEDVGKDLNALDVRRARWDQPRVDLGVDFIPVIHVPNTPSSKSHFGQSSLGPVAQVLDDIAASDTDLAEVQKLVAGPLIAVSGATAPEETEIRPLTILNLGENGHMDVLDVSQGLERMMAAGDRLQDRLHVNAHVPKALTGRIDSATAPSGISMLIDAAPFTSMIGTLRMTREQKGQFLTKFCQRMAQVAGVLPPGPTFESGIRFGNFLPLDRGQVVEEVTKLLAGKVISTPTAVAMIQATGAPIADARREVDAIRMEDYQGAKDIADATGSEPLAAQHLGLELPEGPGPPAVTLLAPTGEQP